MYALALHNVCLRLKTLRTFHDEHALKTYVEAVTVDHVSDPSSDTERWRYWQGTREGMRGPSFSVPVNGKGWAWANARISHRCPMVRKKGGSHSIVRPQ